MEKGTNSSRVQGREEELKNGGSETDIERWRKEKSNGLRGGEGGIKKQGWEARRSKMEKGGRGHPRGNGTEREELKVRDRELGKERQRKKQNRNVLQGQEGRN